MMTPQPPELSFQPPLGRNLLIYNRHLPAQAHSQTISQTFRDAMSVREAVFCNELKAVSMGNDADSDDARACHWVLYSASTGTSSTSAEEKKVTERRPIGTVRLVPSPHAPHPSPGAEFLKPGAQTTLLSSEEVFGAPYPTYAIETPTLLHDGKEPYVKLGRLCIIKEYRGKGFANVLVQEALKWVSKHPGFADGERGWKGLVCVHAQERAVGVWKNNGFLVDQGMGEWWEIGLRILGMWKRVNVCEI